MKAGLFLLTVMTALIAFGFSGQNAYAQGAIQGTVFDADGESVGGAVVAIHQMIRERGVRPYRDRVETDEDGEFAFNRIPAGNYVVMAGAREMGVARTRAVVNDGEITRVRLQLQGRREDQRGRGVIVGTVVDADGAAVPDARVILMRGDRQPGRHARRVNTVTDRQGAFVFENIPEGNYRVAAMTREARGVADVEVVADQRNRVEIVLEGRGGGDDGGGRGGG